MASTSVRNQNGGESFTTLVCPASRCPLPTRNRTFSSAEALLDHARQTRTQHPLCTTCLRIFKDTAALDQHVEAKHVVVCQPCNRRYKSQSALDQHWRASSAHPNCPLCDAGAADTNALAVHIANSHPKVRCCGTLMDESDLDAHYLNSRTHPACEKCNVGFPSEREYTDHNSELHSELQCKICSEQFPSTEALGAHASDPTNHRRCEFCSAQFKDTSALVEHFTETHLQIQDSKDSTTEATSTTLVPSPPTSPRYVHASWGPTSAVVGAERAAAAGRHEPGPPSRASTSLSASFSDIASELCHSPPSMGTFMPSPPILSSSSSSNVFHPQTAKNGALTRLPQPDLGPTFVSGTVLSPQAAVPHASLAVPSIPLTTSSSPSPSPSPPLPVLPRAVGPVTPARRGAHSRSQSQSQLQPQSQSRLQAASQQAGPQPPPSSVRSKVSIAETPSGDLANFHLLNGSPLQSVLDLDTPTPSPRTPSMSSVSPAEAQAFALHAHGGAPFALTADRRFLPGSSVSPSVRAQRAVATPATVRSPFYCRVCLADPCLEITATACGHLFCNACIIEEVRENARCPACYAVVLLFALLRLDVS